jgi:HAD superfamily hydrolase (TIGR01549 family)
MSSDSPTTTDSPLSRIKVISFDLDDTLFACEPVIRRSNEALSNYLYTFHPVLHEHLASTSLDAYTKLVATAYPAKAHDVSFLRRQALFEASTAASLPNAEDVASQSFAFFLHQRSVNCSAHFFPGVVSALNELRSRGYRLATISNGNANVKLIPELADIVEVHVSAIEAGFAKPHTAPFLLLAQKMHVLPNEILHVGDDYRADVGSGVGHFLAG